MGKEKLIHWIRKVEPLIQKYRIGLLVFFAGVLLLGLTATPNADTAADAPDAVQTQDSASAFDLVAFQAELGQQLEAIEGVGNVRLTLTLDTTQEAIYAADIRQTKQNEQDTSYESTLATMTQSSYGQQPIPVKRLYPTFRGALVVCDGAADAAVQLAVTQAVGAVCGLGADKIAVLKMQK